MERFSEKIKRALLKFFMLDAFEFSEIIMQEDVLENICMFAKQTHPKEFVAIIGGKVKEKKLIIDNLFYQEFVSSHHSASFSSFLPSAVHGVGTVHSHPSSNNKPSKADLFFFNKKAGVNFIIGYPYTKETMSCYDLNGNELIFSVVLD
jgi:proteasome lid subunit RPN8/RPN11